MSGRVGKNRNIVLIWLVWPLITLGVYHFVWWYNINREARDLDSRIEVSPALSVLAMTLGAFIIVPPFVSVYRTGARIAQMEEAAGMEPTCSPVIGLLLAFAWGLYSLYYQAELNKLWAHLGNPPEGTQVLLPPAAAAVPAAAQQPMPAPGTVRPA
jgi:Domain of unknown function (DUF4234)